MKTRLAILLWATSPEVPHLCVTPFFHAAAAAAMDVDVEIHFASKSVQLLVDGVASTLYAGTGRAMTVYQHMQQAARFGAKFYACSDAVAVHGGGQKSFIAELTGMAGGATFVGRVLDPEWATLVY